MRNGHWNRLSTIRQRRHRKRQTRGRRRAAARNGKMLHVPSPLPTVSRRRVLVGAAALALLGVPVSRMRVIATAAGGRRADRATRPGPRRQPAGHRRRGRRARGDRAGAHRGGRRARGPRPGAVRRAGPDARPGRARPAPRRPAPPPQPAKAPDREGRDRRAAGLGATARRELAAKLSGYRAGLLGSIAARAPRRTPSRWLRRRRRNDLSPSRARTDTHDDDVVAGRRTHQPDAAAGRRRRRAVRRDRHRARHDLRLRDRVRALHARRQRPGVGVDGRAPRPARGGVGDAGGAVGRGPAARGRLPAADRGRQPHRCGQPRGADGGGRRRRVAGRRRAGHRRAGPRVRRHRADGMRGHRGPVAPRARRRRSRSRSPAAPNSPASWRVRPASASQSAPRRSRRPRRRPGSPGSRR